MEQRTQLTRSILRNVMGFWLLHSCIFGLLVLAYGFNGSLVLWYLVASVALNGILLWVLLFGRTYFYFLDTDKPLNKVNFANQLTLFRISSLPALLLLLIASRHYPVALFLIIYTALAFISDLLDGYVSRTTHQTTRIGQYLDSMSDYAVLLGVAIAFVSFGFISDWFFVLILVRFLSQFVAMEIIYLIQHGRLEPRSSFLAKSSVAVTMFAFAVNLLVFFDWFSPYQGILFWIQMGAGAILLISLAEKMVLFAADLRRALKERRSGAPEKR